MKNSLWKIIFFSIILILAAQLSMNLFVADFKISIAVIFFPVFLFLTEDFPLIPVTFCSAFGVFALRSFIHWLHYGSVSGACFSYLPEMLFYICYGILLYLCSRYWKKHTFPKYYLLLPLALIDYLANLTELLFRIHMDTFFPMHQAGIILIALLRAAIVWCILIIFERYRLLLLKQEHEERYKRLLLLISKLNGEVVWMQKNASMIEDTMSTSYKLFERLSASGAEPSLSADALSVAKDIHEIKKEYLLIMRGISEALEQELKDDGMYLTDLLLLLKDAAILNAQEQKKELHFHLECAGLLYTDKHYALMSIFRNLYNNALEAATSSEIHLSTVQRCDNGSYLFEVTDDGPGIPDEYKEEIFKTGFSTKINYATGSVNRGLGLGLVKDLVENQFSGTIQVSSEPGKTTFTIAIPKEQLEVKPK